MATETKIKNTKKQSTKKERTIDSLRASLNKPAPKKKVIKNKNFNSTSFPYSSKSNIFKHIFFVNCSFNNCDFANCMFYQVEFINCQFTETRFNVCEFYKCNFQKLNIKLTVILKSQLYYTVFENSEMSEGVRFSSSTLCYCKFTNNNMKTAELCYCFLRCVYFNKCDLEGGSFEDSQLSKCDFMSECNIQNIIINGCISDNSTPEIKNIKLLDDQDYDWIITHTRTHLAIGCKMFKIQEWKKFTNPRIKEFGDNAFTFWKKYKKYIFDKIKDNIASDCM